jgi:prepilin-type N-terminal cleavage/methylation domain-containing protein
MTFNNSLRPVMGPETRGFTLVELLVSMVVTLVVLGGVLTFFVNQQQVTREQQQVLDLQTNLRAASDRFTSHLRLVGYGVPADLTWIDWVSGFTANPMVIPGSGSSPDTIRIAACTKPIATITSGTSLAKGAANNTVSLTSAVAGKNVVDLLDTASRKLIRFGAGSASATEGFAWVKGVSGAGATATVTIDTNRGTTGNQGFGARAYFAGTPVCRVDVTTYTVNTTTRTLMIDEHQGAGVQAAFDGITNLQIAGGGNIYDFTIQGTTESAPVITRNLTGTITVRNQ